MTGAVARAYKKSGGIAPSGVQGQRPLSKGQGAKTPEAEALLAFERSMEAANLSVFLRFGNAKKSKICVIFAKKSWVATKLGGWPGAKLWGLCRLRA